MPLLNRVFDYIVPAEMQGTICVGDRVFVPFGKGTNLSEGYVSELKEESEFAQVYQIFSIFSRKTYYIFSNLFSFSIIDIII